MAEVRQLEKRAVGSHLRWAARAAYPGRTPLAAILLYAADLKRETTLDEEQGRPACNSAE